MTRRPEPAAATPAARNKAVWLAAAAAFGVEMAFSARYGYVRDELYFLAAGAHPAAGDVDQPSLTPLLAHLDALVTGNTLVGLRALPALALAALVLLAAAIARALGLGRPRPAARRDRGRLLRRVPRRHARAHHDPARLRCLGGHALPRHQAAHQPRPPVVAGHRRRRGHRDEREVEHRVPGRPAWSSASPVRRRPGRCSVAGTWPAPRCSSWCSPRPTSSGRRRTAGRTWRCSGCSRGTRGRTGCSTGRPRCCTRRSSSSRYGCAASAGRCATRCCGWSASRRSS